MAQHPRRGGTLERNCQRNRWSVEAVSFQSSAIGKILGRTATSVGQRSRDPRFKAPGPVGYEQVKPEETRERPTTLDQCQADDSSNTGLDRCSPQADRPVAEVHGRPDQGGRWRTVARRSRGALRRLAWIERWDNPGQTLGRETRRPIPHRLGSSLSPHEEADHGVGAGSLRADGRVAVADFGSSCRRRRREVEGGRIRAVRRLSRSSQRRLARPASRPTDRRQSKPGPAQAHGQAGPPLGGRPSPSHRQVANTELGIGIEKTG